MCCLCSSQFGFGILQSAVNLFIRSPQFALEVHNDSNLPHVNWSTLSGPCSFSQQMCEFVFDFNLSQHVESPTHVKGKILDIVLTNLSELVSSCSVSTAHPLPTDHSLVSLNISL